MVIDKLCYSISYGVLKLRKKNARGGGQYGVLELWRKTPSGRGFRLDRVKSKVPFKSPRRYIYNLYTFWKANVKNTTRT